MTPATYNITIRRGNDFNRLFDFQQPDGKAMDLTNWKVKSQIRRRKIRTAKLVAEFVVSIPNPSDGAVGLSLTDSVTTSLDAGTAYYDVLLTSPEGDDETYIEGVVTIEPTVTLKG